MITICITVFWGLLTYTARFQTKEGCLFIMNLSKRNWVLLSVSLLGCLFSSGCATLFSQSAYNVYIDKNENADSFKVIDTSSHAVVAQGKESRSVFLNASSGFFSKAHYDIRFYKEGEQVESRHLSSQVDGTMLFNILFWPGFFIDGASGSCYKLPQGS